MTRTSPTLPLSLAGIVLLIAAVVWPTFALWVQCIVDGRSPMGGYVYSTRQLLLLADTLFCSAAASVLALLAAIPVVHLLSCVRSSKLLSPVIALLILCLACPPAVYAFGWSYSLLPVITLIAPDVAVPKWVLCVFIWSSRMWPMVSLVMTIGWLCSGKTAMEAARLETSMFSAFLHIGWPAIAPYALFSFFSSVILLFCETSVPHALGINVYATELLGWATNSANPIDTIWPAGPLAVIVLVIVATLFLWSRRFHVDVGLVTRKHAGGKAGFSAVIMIIELVMFWVIPILGLVRHLKTKDAFTDAWQNYSSDVTWSFLTALFAGVLALWMGIVAISVRRWSVLLMLWALVIGVLPGALVGQALVAAYNYPFFAWLYDHWPILVLAYLTRFSWIAVLAVWAMARRGQIRREQARVDGASELFILTRIYWPAYRPILLVVVWLIASLSIAEAAATSLTRPPTFQPIALLILDKFHFFQDDMVISLSLIQIVMVLPLVWLMTCTVRAVIRV